MLRYAPYHIVNRLKQYDRDLNIEWCEKLHRWWFTRKGRQMFTWVHDDGRPGLDPSGCGDELMRIIEIADSHTKSQNILKRMDAAERDRLYEKERFKQKAFAECRKASDKTMDFARRGGPKPFVQVQDNPITTKESCNA